MAQTPKKALLLVFALLAAGTGEAHAQVSLALATEDPDSDVGSLEDEYGQLEDGEELDGVEPFELRYILEAVEIRGNDKTRSRVIRDYVPFAVGEVIDPESEELDTIELRLRGTGWFRSVQLRLRRGSERGHVVIQINVDERNSIVIEQVALGVSEGVNSTRDANGDVRLYGGFTVAQTNLAGTGVRFAMTALLARNNQGVRLDVVDPTFLRSRYNFRVGTHFIDAREYFGVAPLVGTPCGPTAPITCAEEIDTQSAVVFYRRGGWSIGTGRHLNRATRYSLDWVADILVPLSVPGAASDVHGSEVVPIDFHIHRDQSFVSSIRFELVHDRRDDPVMPTDGMLFQVAIDAGNRLVGSDYDYLQLQSSITWWKRLPWGHSFRIHAFGGVTFGDAPFYLLYHISDFTDLIPSRILQIELDRRQAPNIFGTSIAFMRKEEVAMRLDVGYDLPLYRSQTRGLRQLNAYFNIGVYSLASLQDLGVAVPGFTGAARIPIDLTFDLGLRFDTRVGVFQVGFSNFLGFFAL